MDSSLVHTVGLQCSEILVLSEIVFNHNSFTDFINSLKLLHFSQEVGSFTERNNQGQPSIPHFDRFLALMLREDHYQNVVQWFLPQLVSYYYPILLDYGGLRGVEVCFNLRMWLKELGMVDGIAAWHA